MAGKQPTVLLAFANDHANGARYLRELSQERKALEGILGKAAKRDLCQINSLPDATLGDVWEAFQRETNEAVAIFHYAGHAGQNVLWLESVKGNPQAAYAEGLARFLGRQTSLVLVFLNGCATRGHVDELLSAGVKVVIATSHAVADDMARAFAEQFYKALATGRALEEAYLDASDHLETTLGSNLRAAYRTLTTTPEDGAHELTKTITDHGLPWHLFVRPGAEKFKRWSLPQAANNPLFGLPPVPEGDLPPKPFKHLHWFTRQDAEIFFGRGHDIRTLYESVTDVRGAPLLFLYGQTGVGKSSLLAAGLLPRLETTHQPYYVRREPALGLLGTLERALNVATGASLREVWKTFEAATGKPLLIVLDQLEEAFTQPNKTLPDELSSFVQALSSLFLPREGRPLGKLVLGFRKEWLAEISKQFEETALPYASIFLDVLSRDDITEAVTGSATSERLQRHYRLELEASLPEKMADDLLADDGSPVAPTLQILLSKMWDEAKKLTEVPRFTEALYETLKRDGILLADFLEQQLQTLATKQEETVRSGLALDVLALFTTPLGAGKQHHEEDVQQLYGEPRRERVNALLSQSKDLYLLADVIDAPRDHKLIRLAHDTLAPLVRDKFMTSTRPGQRARRILESLAPEWQGDKEGTPLSERDLGLVEQGKAGMRLWTKDEERLVATSRVIRNKEKEQQEKISRRLTLLSRFRVALSILLLGVAIYALSERSRAEQQALQALSNLLLLQARETKSTRPDQAVLLYSEVIRIGNKEKNKVELDQYLKQVFSPQLVHLVHAHDERVADLAFSPDGTLLASASLDDRVVLWEILGPQRPTNVVAGGSLPDTCAAEDTCEPSRESTYALRQRAILTCTNCQTTGDVDRLVFNSDGTVLVSGGRDNVVMTWDVSSGDGLACETSLATPSSEDYVTALAMNENGSLLVSGHYQGGLALWTIGDQNCSLKRFIPSYKFASSAETGGTYRATSIVHIGLDGALLVVVLSDGRILRLDSAALLAGDDTVISECVTNPLQTIDISAKQQVVTEQLGLGPWLVSSAFYHASEQSVTLGMHSGEVVRWLINDCRQQPNWPTASRNSKTIYDLSFIPEQQRMALARDGATLNLLKDSEGKADVNVRGHTSAVHSVAFREELLASGDESGNIILWNLALPSTARETPLETVQTYACSLVNRNFNNGEWEKFSERNVPAPLTCPKVQDSSAF
jgi:CHAT domain/WD domain, G-beta repeat